VRDLLNQITQSYRAAKIESQDPGTVLVRAQEPDTKQPVWIQVLRGALLQDPKIAARFRSLAQAIRQLNHPNIASIRAVGEKGGLPYIVVRALERAQPLAAKLDRPWAVDEAADLVMQAGEALEHAYKKGVLHGNLSPDSIWVEEDGHVQVTGFGVRQILDLLQVRLKQADSPYLAPERRAGQPADARADVYSLAAILYGLLARRAPVVIQGRVLPAGRFNPDTPAAMDSVVVKALSQDPADRYPDVRSFVAALGAVVLAPVIRTAVGPAAPGVCPKCGTKNPAGRFCTKCGSALPQLCCPAREQPQKGRRGARRSSPAPAAGRRCRRWPKHRRWRPVT
jgi:serine/threonine protein kinase